MNNKHTFFTVYGVMSSGYVSTFTGQIFPIDSDFDSMPVGYFSLYKKDNQRKYKIINYIPK